MTTLHLDEFLECIPKHVSEESAAAVTMTFVANEFKLTRKEFINALAERNYFVAAAGGTIAFSKSKKEIQRIIDGGGYYDIEEVK